MQGKRHSRQILCPGGVIATNKLRAAAELATTVGDGYLILGHRQDLHVDGIQAFDLAKFTREAESRGLGKSFQALLPNITSSLSATDVCRRTTWLTEGIFQSLLDNLPERPAISINIADPEQSLTPLFSSTINMVASPIPQHWYTFVRTGCENKLEFIPFMFHQDYIPELMSILPHNLLSNKKSGEVTEFLTNYWEGKLIACKEEPVFDIGSPPEIEGFHLSAGSNQYWLGIFAESNRLPAQFLHDLSMLAHQQDIATVGITPWRSILVNGIKTQELDAWRQLLGRHQIATRHSELELYWKSDLLNLKKTGLQKKIKQSIMRKLRCTSGLSFSFGDNKEIFECVVHIQPMYFNDALNFVLPLNKFKIFLRPRTVSKNCDYSIWKEKVSFKQLPEIILEVVKKYSSTDNFVEESSLPAPTNANSFDEQLKFCPHCLTEYNPLLGDPDRDISAETPFEYVPDSWTCPLCDSPKAAFVS